MEMANKWYGLADQMAGASALKDQAQIGAQGNMGLNSGLSALGFRGNNNTGSMERLAGANVASQGAAGVGLGQSKYNKLAELYGQGMGQIELPTLIGQDQAAAQKNASNQSNTIGNFFSNLRL